MDIFPRPYAKLDRVSTRLWPVESWSYLPLAHETCRLVFPTLHSATSHWQVETDHGGNIYTL